MKEETVGGGDGGVEGELGGGVVDSLEVVQVGKRSFMTNG